MVAWAAVELPVATPVVPSSGDAVTTPWTKRIVAALIAAELTGYVIVTVPAVVSAVVTVARRIATCFVPAALLLSASFV